MAEEVLDSWEDMIDESGRLVNKLDDFRLNDPNLELRPDSGPFVANNSNTNTDSLKNSSDGLVWPSVVDNKAVDNMNPIKILKRESLIPSITSPQNDSTLKSPNESNQNQMTSVCPQITLEDNTRTQYVAPVRILKRPNANSSKDPNDKSLAIDRKTINGNKSQANSKTYEEREAEYAKARLRILGSASAPEEITQTSGSLPSSAQTGNTYNLSPNSSPKSSQNKSCVETNVPILRLPIGPDGTKGFDRELTSQQR